MKGMISVPTDGPIAAPGTPPAVPPLVPQSRHYYPTHFTDKKSQVHGCTGLAQSHTASKGLSRDLNSFPPKPKCFFILGQEIIFSFFFIIIL